MQGEPDSAHMTPLLIAFLGGFAVHALAKSVNSAISRTTLCPCFRSRPAHSYGYFITLLCSTSIGFKISIMQAQKSSPHQ